MKSAGATDKVAVMDPTKDDLGDIVEKFLKQESGTEKAIQTLHPAKDPDKLDRLTILSPQEISAHGIVDWEIKVLKMDSLASEWVAEGLSNKLKALKCSIAGQGRGEIGNLFKPEIIGSMLQQGQLPMLPQQQAAAPRGNFLSRFFKPKH